MPTKPVKKTTLKSTAAKKTVAKKATVKKPAVKKTVPQAAKPDTAAMKHVVAAPVVEAHAPQCPCGPECKCGGDCKCARRGSRFGRFVIKLIVALIIFALGFAAAKLVDNGRAFGPRVDFDDGCLVVSSVKCPQLQALLPVMDMDQDGCISREEFRAVNAELHRQMRAAGIND